MAENDIIDAEAIARKCVEICEQHKAADILLFDVREKTILADFFLVCSGTSLPHLRAIAENIRRTLLDEGISPRGRDGSPSSQWLVLDYGIIIIHVLMPELRRFYALEDLWDKTKVIYSGGTPLPPDKHGTMQVQPPPPPPADIDEGYPIDERYLDFGDEKAEDDL
ncbi:MAG: ribosome silencing factor [Victivallales bacterium]|nr:ribosome silencing factor [Victivallales bacterium]